MQLQDFFDYKNKLMEDILTEKEIVSLINEEVAFKDAATLAYSQVFPYEYIPQTVQEGYTFVCFDVDISSAVGKTFYIPTIYVWVFSHRSRLRLPKGGVRPDKLCSEICKKINGSRFYGIGELRLTSAKRFAPITDYQGKLLTFNTREFSKVFDGKRPIPSNRKAGV